MPDLIAKELDAPPHALDALIRLVNSKIEPENYRLENRTSLG